MGGAFDVVVVGGSIAGCASARLFARAGARVALVEKRPSADAYKVVCTHQIQSSAVPAIERLGLAPLLERANAARTRAATWSTCGGWLLFPRDAPTGYGITRKRLDPMLRELATGTPGVEYLPGEEVVGVLRDGDGDRVGGVETTKRRIHARLTVAADGRGSTVARLARVPARIRPHNRFIYFAYWSGVATPRDEARIWLLDPDTMAVFPDEDGLTLIGTMVHKARLPEFRRDRERVYTSMIEALPDGPGLTGAERVSKLVGKLDMPNALRPAAAPGIAFVGDAALAADPLFGVGCGWAFQSAEWLAERAAPALLGGGDRDLDRALRRYRRTFLRRLGPHHLQIADYSTGRRLRLNERLIFRTATRDPDVGAALERVATRRASAFAAFDPRYLPRLLTA